MTNLTMQDEIELKSNSLELNKHIIISIEKRNIIEVMSCSEKNILHLTLSSSFKNGGQNY